MTGHTGGMVMAKIKARKPGRASALRRRCDEGGASLQGGGGRAPQRPGGLLSLPLGHDAAGGEVSNGKEGGAQKAGKGEGGADLKGEISN